MQFKVDMSDIRYSLFELFHAQDLLKYEKYNHLDLQQLEDVLKLTERMAVEVVSPLNPLLNYKRPQYKDGKVLMPEEFHSAYKTYSSAGWISSLLDKRSGGWGLPEIFGMAIREIFNGACGGFYGGFSSLTMGAMNLIQNYGTEDIKRLYVEKMSKGVYSGTMCLTEPESGSYLADIKTSAKREGSIFKIKGTKTFIGAGDHDLTKNIVHCVLARIEGAPRGYAGISLFVVPKFRAGKSADDVVPNDVACIGIEDKMGWDAAPTATLKFGENDECKGWLLGPEGNGLALMFQMMNEMRLAIAAQGVGQASAAYQIALSYTKNRIQGLSYKKQKGDPAIQVPIIDHPDIRRNLLFMKTIVEGCRRLILQTALYIDISKASTDEREKEYYNDLVEILIPICKAYSTDMGFIVAETAVLSMGGYGYMKEFRVERYLRDILVACIYEGTNGIHAIDLQRRKLNQNHGRLFSNLLKEIEVFIKQHCDHATLSPLIQKLDSAKQIMAEVASSFSKKRAEDSGLPLSVAKPYLDLTGHVLCTWMLLKSAVVADELCRDQKTSASDREFYQGKIFSAQFAVANLLPQVEGLKQSINCWDRSVLDVRPENY